jgi:DNA-binding transcriptional LysR family regulator
LAKSQSAHSISDIAWDDVRLFLAVIESGSLSAAARSLQLGQPTLSRRMGELEDRVGYRLFRRVPHGVVPTPQAERWVSAARRMAECAGELARTAAGAEAAPRGLVRIAAPPGVGFDFLAPFCGWLKEKHPETTVQVLCSVTYVDLVRGDADLALRMRGATSPDLKVVATLHHENAAFASRAYASRLPRKYGFADVDWIAWAPPFEQLPPNPQLEALIPNFRPAFASDNFLVMWRAAEAGLGAMVLGKVAHRFARGPQLVPLNLDLGPHARSALHLVCARSALDSPRVRLVAELLAEELERAS